MKPEFLGALLISRAIYAVGAAFIRVKMDNSYAVSDKLAREFEERTSAIDRQILNPPPTADAPQEG